MSERLMFRVHPSRASKAKVGRFDVRLSPGEAQMLVAETMVSRQPVDAIPDWVRQLATAQDERAVPA